MPMNITLGMYLNTLCPPGHLCVLSGASEKPGGDAARVGCSTRRRMSEDVTPRTRGVPLTRATDTRRYSGKWER